MEWKTRRKRQQSGNSKNKINEDLGQLRFSCLTHIAVKVALKIHTVPISSWNETSVDFGTRLPQYSPFSHTALQIMDREALIKTVGLKLHSRYLFTHFVKVITTNRSTQDSYFTWHTIAQNQTRHQTKIVISIHRL